MKRFRDLIVLCGAVLLIAGCPIPMGDNLSIYREGNTNIIYITDYNLQSYVPIPKIGEAPVTLASRGDMDVSVVWKDSAGIDLPSLSVFQADTVYRAGITLTPKDGYGFDPSTPFAYHPGKITSQVDDLGNPARIVTVTYNNSNDADITFITDYNLQSYVPAPIAGEEPVVNLTTREDLTAVVTWKVQEPPGSDTFAGMTTSSFEQGRIYQSTIELKTKPGYRFFEEKNFTYTNGSETSPVGSVSDPDARHFTVTYLATRAPWPISDFNLTTYIAKPVSGITAVGSFAAPQYTGTVIWKNTGTQAALVGPFQYGTAYTAELILTPVSGYTIRGVGQDAFRHTGADTGNVTNPADSGTVTISFPSTSNAPSPTVVYDTILTNRIPQPVNRATPVGSFRGSQYSGTVVWKNTRTQAALAGHFVTGTEYTAVITLTAFPGYTFIGIGQNVFTHAAVTAPDGVKNSQNSGTITINFLPAVPSTIPAMTFGPVGAEDSALKVMQERKDDNNPVAIELPEGEEDVIPNTVSLLKKYNCPINITIDGNGRVLKLQGPGTLMTVRNGITLILTDITLEGKSDNSMALIKVETGGRLILDTGAVLTANTGCGVWVNGGELIMNDGAVIKKMEDYGNYSGGAVTVDASGKFTMNGGIIGGESAGDGNGNSCGSTVAAAGVGVTPGGVFTMNGGNIQFNESAGIGGVLLGGGTFNMFGGSIKGNKGSETSATEGVGGVYIRGGTFVMRGSAAVIEDNEGYYGGVSNSGTFTMTAGTIRRNHAQGGMNTAGGVTCGIGVADSITTMVGGSIIDNTVNKGDFSGGGVYIHNGTFQMQGGAIQGNDVAEPFNYGCSGGGVYVYDGTFQMQGGTIEGNTNDGNDEYGVYVADTSYGKFIMSGAAQVDAGNKVFLEINKVITIGGALTGSPVADIIHESPISTGTHLLESTFNLATDDYASKFLYAGSNAHFDYSGSGGTWYLDYKL